MEVKTIRTENDWDELISEDLLPRNFVIALLNPEPGTGMIDMGMKIGRAKQMMKQTKIVKSIWETVQNVRTRLVNVNHTKMGITGDSAENKNLLRYWSGAYMFDYIQCTNYHDKGFTYEVNRDDFQDEILVDLIVVACGCFPSLDWRVQYEKRRGSDPVSRVENVCDQIQQVDTSETAPGLLIDLWESVTQSAHAMFETITEETLFEAIEKRLIDNMLYSPTRIKRTYYQLESDESKGETGKLVSSSIDLNDALRLLTNFGGHVRYGASQEWADISNEEKETLHSDYVAMREVVNRSIWDETIKNEFGVIESKGQLHYEQPQNTNT